MDTLVTALTWERLLVIWGFLAPAIAWVATRSWERKSRLDLWDHENELRKEQIALEEKRQQEDRKREEVEQLRERMRDTYTRFLKGASAATLVADGDSINLQAQTSVHHISDFVLSFQQLILIASTDTARPAVEIWRLIEQLKRLPRGDDATPELKEKLMKARSRFVSEAREDLENPLIRNSNPGVTVKPAITAGGFHLTDVG